MTVADRVAKHLPIPLLAIAMLVAVAGVAALASWDERREQAAALEDFAQEQASLAAAAVSELQTRLAAASRDAQLLAEDGAAGKPSSLQIERSYLTVRRVQSPAAPGEETPDRGGLALDVPVRGGSAVELVAAPSELFGGIARLERPRSIALFVSAPDGRLRAMDGRLVRSPELSGALSSGGTTVRLAPPAAAALGLTERTAMAGLARVNVASLGTWSVAVVASAQRERDREQRARGRLILAVALAAGLVLGFGGFALQQQRKELSIARELDVAQLVRERDEQLADLSRAATMVTFAGGVAHEISTPLGIIAGRAEQLLPRLAGDERSHRCVQAILDQTEHVKQVIRGFLDLARGGRPELQEIDPASIVESAAALVEHRFTIARVHLRTRIPAGLPMIRGDPRLLGHALVNLSLNACDACSPGGAVEIRVAGDTEEVAFVVTDDGAGIPSVVADRLAEAFFTTKPHGTGLGLAIANEIAKIHRGTLRLEPATPRGTRACLRIPLAQGEAHA